MNGIIYEPTDSWWTKYGATVGFILVYGAIYVAIVWGMLQ